MKKNIKKIILILIMIALIVLSFLGIYTNENNEALIPEYKLSDIFSEYYEIVMDVDNTITETDVFVDENGNTIRKVPAQGFDPTSNEEKKIDMEKVKEFSPDDETPKYKVETRLYGINKNNADDTYNANDVETSKNYLANLLKSQNIGSFNVRKQKGDTQIVFEIPQTQNNDIANIEKTLSSYGKFSLEDTKTGREYLNNSHIKEAKLMEYPGYAIFLDINLTDEGKDILEDVSKKYVQTREYESEDPLQQQAEQTEEEEYQTISVKIGNNTHMRGGFEEPMTDGKMQIVLLDMQTIQDETQLKEASKEARIVSEALKAGDIPLKYNIVSSNLVESPVNKIKLNVLLYVLAGIAVILAAALIIFFGVKGLGSAIILISYLAGILLLIRYTNIEITVAGITGIVALYFIEFAILWRTNNKYIETGYVEPIESFGTITRETIILTVMAIILSFSVNIELASLGQILFLGILMQVIHNYIFVKHLLEGKKTKNKNKRKNN